VSTENPLYADKDLFARIAEGEETAFHQLFASYVPFLQPTIYKIVKDDHAAQDIIQETFLRLWIHRDKMPGIENPRSWILRIAYYRAFSYLRSMSVYDKAVNSLTVTGAEPTETTGPEDALVFNDMRRQVEQAVDLLPGQQQKAWELSRKSGLSIADIALAMNLSPQSVKNTLGRAQQFIRNHLEKAGYGAIYILLLTKR
jgi:RNA polymerase sigma-70 factor (family 1)